MRGQHKYDAPLCTFYTKYSDIINRMNEDYNLFFNLRYWPDGRQWGLHSAIFYFLSSTRSLWEEHKVVHNLAQKGKRKSSEADMQQLSIPNFIILCAEALIAEDGQ